MSDPKKERVIAPQSQEIPLDYPVDIEGVKTSSLTMRRAKVKDWLAHEDCQGQPLKKEVFIIARLCDQPPSLIGELDDCDYESLQSILNGKGDSVVPLSEPENSGSGAPDSPEE